MSKQVYLLLILTWSACTPSTEATENLPQPMDQGKEFSPSELQVEPVAAVTDAHIRGIYLIDGLTGWASGAKGTILRMTNGKTWKVINPEGYAHLDFRDIHGFDSLNAVAMAAGDEGRIIRTSDGGISWREVYSDLSEGIFLDGLDFNDSLGICYGDPLDGVLYGVYSQDYGKSWTRSSMAGFPSVLPGEAGFAASGTGIVVLEDREYTATGGGPAARVIRSMRETAGDHSTTAIEVPLRSGEGCGIFSLAFKSKDQGVAIGGCYLDSASTLGNCAVTFDAGDSWQSIDSLPPAGYRSCVVYSSSADFYLCCGRNGIDISTDDGRSWSAISNEGYYTCAVADHIVWLMGRSGKMARIAF